MNIRILLLVVSLCCSVTWVGPVTADDSHDRLWQGAAERIERHRKANASITVVDAAGEPVRDLRVSLEQTRHAFLFGCNIFRFGRARTEQQEVAYRRQFAELFNYATIGFYWSSYEREAGQPDHEYAGRVARWCKEQGITTKGHPLAWNYSDPRWLPDSSADIRRLQLARITDCVSRFQGLIDIWDVVNEATHFDRAEFQRRAPKMTKMWEDTGQLEFVNQCFRAARSAGPEATLLINDYRTDAKYAELISQMARIDGQPAYDVIGIQSHMHHGVWSNEKLWEVCERFSQFNVPLHFTELTVLSGSLGWEKGEDWPSTPAGETSQQEDVCRIYTMLFSHPSVTAITWWDFADLNAWQRAPAGLLDKELRPKPAYDALKELIKKQWWTRADAMTDAVGRVQFRGFLGDYRVEVAIADGRSVRARLQLVDGDENQLRIELPPDWSR